MMELLQAHYEALSVLIAMATLLVWLTYAQLLYLNYRRQRRPHLIINLAQGYHLGATVLLSNMSAEPIHVECVMLVVHCRGRQAVRQVSELPYREGPDGPAELSSRTRQGPLASGGYMSLGTFRELLETCAADVVAEWQLENVEHDDYAAFIEHLELRVAAIYASEDLPVGALRRFRIRDTDTGVEILPMTLQTVRMATRSQRREVIAWLETCAQDGSQSA